MMKSKLWIVAVGLALLVVVFIYYAMPRGLVSRFRPHADDEGVEWTHTNVIVLEVEDIGVALDRFRELWDLDVQNIRFYLGTKSINVEILGNDKGRSCALLLSESKKIGRVLKYSLSEGLNTPERMGITVSIDLVETKYQES